MSAATVRRNQVCIKTSAPSHSKAGATSTECPPENQAERASGKAEAPGARPSIAAAAAAAWRGEACRSRKQMAKPTRSDPRSRGSRGVIAGGGSAEGASSGAAGVELFGRWHEDMPPMSTVGAERPARSAKNSPSGGAAARAARRSIPEAPLLSVTSSPDAPASCPGTASLPVRGATARSISGATGVAAAVVSGAGPGMASASAAGVRAASASGGSAPDPPPVLAAIPPGASAAPPPSVSSSVTDVARCGRDSNRSCSSSRLAATSSTVAHADTAVWPERREGSPALSANWKSEMRPTSWGASVAWGSLAALPSSPFEGVGGVAGAAAASAAASADGVSRMVSGAEETFATEKARTCTHVDTASSNETLQASGVSFTSSGSTRGREADKARPRVRAAVVASGGRRASR
eukprot:scaffold5866_cov93-Isochrysis_galbana.AAC.1